MGLVHLLGEEAFSRVLNRGTDQSDSFESEAITLASLPVSESGQGVCILYAKALSVSSCGERVWACQIQEKVRDDYQSRLVRLDYETDSSLFYDYKHPDLIVSVLVSEALKIAMSGGFEKTLVLHALDTGKTLRRIDMKYGFVRCLFDLGSAVVVGDEHTLRFLDLETQKMSLTEVRTTGDWIKCVGLSISRADENQEMTLLVGGQNSNKVGKITVPQTITKLGKHILEIRDRPRKTQKFQRKMIDLASENERLKKEFENVYNELCKLRL